MVTGDLVLFRGHGFFAWLIRAWTRSSWAHCGVLWVCEGVPLVIEARAKGGVSVHALRNRLEDHPDIYATGRALNLNLALRHLGGDYSIKDAIRAGLGKRGDHAGWECAELAAMLLGLDHEAEGWTPQGLANALLT